MKKVSIILCIIASIFLISATVYQTIQFRRGTSTEWTAANPVLAQGEPGYETNTKKFKIGDGLTHWNDLLLYPGLWIDAGGYSTLASANTAAYNAGKLLIISQNHILTANTTLTASVMRIPGGSFTKASTYTLTFSGSFQNPDNGQCFIGFAAGDVTGLKEARPEWWQTNTTPGTTDMMTAFRCATSSISATDGRLELLATTYLLSDGIPIAGEHITIKGDSWDSTLIKIPNTFNLAASGVFYNTYDWTAGYDQGNVMQEGPTFRDFSIYFQQPDTAVRSNLVAYPPCFQLSLVNASPRFRMERIRISRAMTAIDASNNCGGAILRDVHVSAFDYGIKLNGALDTVRIIGFHFWPFSLTAANQQTIMQDGNAVGIQAGRVDDLHLIDSMFLSGKSISLYLKNMGTAGFGQIVGNDFDASYGVKMEQGRFVFSGNTFTSSQITRSFYQTGGYATIVGGEFIQGDGTTPLPVIEFSGATIARLTIIGVDFEPASKDTKVIYGAGAGKTLIVNANQFRREPNGTYTYPIIHLDTGVQGIITNNKNTGSQLGNFITFQEDNYHIIQGNDFNLMSLTGPSAYWTKAQVRDNINLGNGDYFANQLAGRSTVMRFTGTLDGSGNAVFAHGITDAPRKVISCLAFKKGPSGEMIPLTVSYIDGNNISITGGSASQPYRVSILVTETIHAW